MRNRARTLAEGLFFNSYSYPPSPVAPGAIPCWVALGWIGSFFRMAEIEVTKDRILMSTLSSKGLFCGVERLTEIICKIS